MPSWGAVAVSAVGAIGSLVSSSNSSDKAKDAQQKATKTDRDLQKYFFDETMKRQEPWRLAGEQALKDLQNPLASFYASPDYEYRVSQGINALNQNNAVNGMLKSGKTITDSVTFGENIGAAEFGDWWNRRAGVAGLGQTANAQTQQAGQFYVNGTSNALYNGANAAAQSSYQQANNTNQAIGGLVGAVNWGLNNWAAQQQQQQRTSAYNAGSYFGRMA